MFQFERVVCVSLARRQDRWQKFLDQLPSDWPFEPVELFNAVDGKKSPAPDWWRAGNGAWGCLKSHLNILEECLQHGIESCLFLEDDAVCCDDFSNRVGKFLGSLPDDWGMIYLGGQHLWGKRNPPIQVNPDVYIPYNVNRTHAFAVRGKPMMRALYKHLNAFQGWQKAQHIDHHLGRLHQRRENPIYCPNEWLIGQDEGRSDISWKELKLRFFPPADNYPAVDNDFVCVMGLHRSGSSCLAMMLHKLGVHMGNRLVGYEGRHGGGGEAHGLAQICEQAMPFPQREIKGWQGKLQARLLGWIRDRQNEANDQGTLAGGKYPHLAAMGELLETTLQGRMKVIHASRPLSESIESLVKREPNIKREKIAKLQEFLWESKNAFLSQTNAPVLNVEYRDVLKEPERAVKAIIRFLDINPSQDQIDAAIKHPKPAYRTVAAQAETGR
jgi:hypothetical protein